MTPDDEFLLERARKLGTQVELVIVHARERPDPKPVRLDYAELETRYLVHCERVTILVHDPRTSRRIFSLTLASEPHAALDRQAITAALRGALDHYEQRFPGTMP